MDFIFHMSHRFQILLAEETEDLALGETGLDRMWSEGLLTT